MNLKIKTPESTGAAKEAGISGFIILLTSALTGLITFYLDGSAARVMQSTIVVLLGGLTILFLWYQSVFSHTLEYDNEKHPIRFFVIYFISYLLSMGMVFLPVESWYFMPVMVLLSLFSNFVIGLTAGCVLLVAASGLTVQATIYSFFLYFILGLIAISLFRKLDLDFRIGEPLFLCALSSLVLQTAYLVLFKNQPLHVKSLILPLINLLINLVLMFFILKYFSNMSMYHIQDKYAEINNPDFLVLSKLKHKDKEHYLEAVNRADLSERLAQGLQLNSDIIKGCSYYYKLAKETKKENKDFIPIQDFFDFPPELKALMQECMEEHFGSKEACVVLTADRVFSRIHQAQKETSLKDADCTKIVSEIFSEMVEGDCLLDCDMSIKELRIMKNVIIEEKLYHDFLY